MFFKLAFTAIDYYNWESNKWVNSMRQRFMDATRLENGRINWNHMIGTTSYIRAINMTAFWLEEAFLHGSNTKMAWQAMQAVYNVVEDRLKAQNSFGANQCPGHQYVLKIWKDILEYFKKQYNVCPNI